MAVNNAFRYFFDAKKHKPEGMVSVSQIQQYMSCKQKWAYGYVEALTPRIERAYLTIGKLCHKGMEATMRYRWSTQQSGRFEKTTALEVAHAAMYQEWREYMARTTFLAEELPEQERTLEDALSVFSQAFDEFDIARYEVYSIRRTQKSEPIPCLELHFVIPCGSTRGLHGYIDAILRDTETGSIWCVDYKFRKSLSPDTDEAYNIQNTVYTRACAMLQVPITGTMTWQHLNTPAAEPALLKNGTISRAKIKTTWARYAAFVAAAGQDPENYRAEMEEKLADIEWYRATYEYRNPDTVEKMWESAILPFAKAIKRSYRSSDPAPKSMYPWNCKMCQFQSLCQAELRGYDTAAIRTAEYVKRSHTLTEVDDNKGIDTGTPDVV